jgi:hypothetical protein
LVRVAEKSRKLPGAQLREVHQRCIAQPRHETPNLFLVFAALRFPLLSQSVDFRLAPIQLLSAGNQSRGLLVDLGLPPLYAERQLDWHVLEPLLLLT